MQRKSSLLVILIAILAIFPSIIRADDDEDLYKRTVWEGLPTRYGQWIAGQQVTINMRISIRKWFDLVDDTPPVHEMTLDLVRPWKRDKRLNIAISDRVDRDGFYSVSFTLPDDLSTSDKYQLLVRKRGWIRRKKLAYSPFILITSKKDKGKYTAKPIVKGALQDSTNSVVDGSKAETLSKNNGHSDADKSAAESTGPPSASTKDPNKAANAADQVPSSARAATGSASSKRNSRNEEKKPKVEEEWSGW